MDIGGVVARIGMALCVGGGAGGGEATLADGGTTMTSEEPASVESLAAGLYTYFLYANAAAEMKMTGNTTPRTMPRVSVWLV